MPSADVAGDVAHFVDVVGAALVFAIEAFGTRVAMVRLGDGPALLFAGYLFRQRPYLGYRVADVAGAAAVRPGRGFPPAPRLGIRRGPSRELPTPGGPRVAISEVTGPEDREQL